MENTDQKQKAKAHYGRPSVPPNLFTEKEIKKMSRLKHWTLNSIFIAVSLLVLFFPMSVTVKASGKTVPAVIYAVDAPFEGRVEEIYSSEGMAVKAGDAILKIKSEKLLSEMEQIEKELEIIATKILSSETELKTQAAKTEKSRLYYEVGSISLSEKNETEENLTVAQQQHAILLKEKEKISAKIAYFKNLQSKQIVIAPADGFILSGLKDKLGKMLSEGEELIKLASKDLNIEILVTEDQAAHVWPGANAKIRFYSNPLMTYKARVLKMDSKVEEEVERIWLKKNVVKITLEVQRDVPLTPGMKAYAAISSGKRLSLLQKIVTRILF